MLENEISFYGAISPFKFSWQVNKEIKNSTCNDSHLTILILFTTKRGLHNFKTCLHDVLVSFKTCQYEVFVVFYRIT